MNRIIIPYLQIGGYKVETPVGLSELLEAAWSNPKENDEVEEFASKFTRNVYKNSDGKLVTRYKRR